MKNVHKGSLFCQLLSLFNRHDFARHVCNLEAEYQSKGFSCWDQFVAMLFCQLAQAKSLREITQGLQCYEGRLPSWTAANYKQRLKGDWFLKMHSTDQILKGIIRPKQPSVSILDSSAFLPKETAKPGKK